MQSSAKSRQSDFSLEGRPLIYIRNMMWPRTMPLGRQGLEQTGTLGGSP